MHHLNLSGHTHLDLCVFGIGVVDPSSGARSWTPEGTLPPWIRWDKCDLNLYKETVCKKLSGPVPVVECSLDVELLVRSISSTLHKASEMSCPEP